MLHKNIASVKLAAALVACIAGGALQNSAIATTPNEVSLSTTQKSEIETANVASQPVTPSVVTEVVDPIANPEMSSMGVISREAVNLQPEFSDDHQTFEFSSTSLNQQPLLAREVDLETLCRSFPLNSRCNPPEAEIETTEPASETEPTSETETIEPASETETTEPASEIETEPSSETETTEPTSETETTEPASETELSTTDSSAEELKAVNGFYIGVGGGTQSRERSAEETTAIDFERGYGLNGVIGYRINNFRLEGEVSYFNNGNEAFVFLPDTSEPATGQIALRAFMFNVYYDIPIRRSRFKPYIGAGLGTYKSDIQGFSSPTLISATNFPPNGVVLDVTSRETFAYQLRAGVGYLFNPRTEAFLGYRYFHGNRLEFQTGNPFGVLRPSGAHTHTIEAGFRYSF